MNQPKALQHKNNLIAQISKFFNKEKVEQLARETKFVQRESKLNSLDFLLMCMFAHQNDDEISLEQLSVGLLHDGVTIRKQSIQDRFNPFAVAFLKAMLEEGLRQKLQIKTTIKHAVFNRIVVEDSTSYQLPEEYKMYYKGSGGSASESVIKIHYVYDLMAQKIIEMEFTEGNNPDANLKLYDVKKTTVD